MKYTYHQSQWSALSIAFIFSHFFLLITPFKGIAQIAQKDTAAYESSTSVLPAISSSPETSLLLGGVLLRRFKMGNSYEDTRSSTAMLSAVYTLNNQVSVGFFPNLFLPDEKWVMEGSYGFDYFPENFWGIGQSTREEDEIKIFYRQIFLRQSILHKIYPNVFVGPQFHWTKTYDLNFENTDGEIMPAPDIRGTRDYYNFGAGAVFRWDDRNRSTTPTSGKFMQFSFMANPTWLGKTDSYTKYLFDARQYVDLSEDGSSVWAFQGIIQLGTGNPPFKEMALLGGESIMRGYYSGRYRDQNGAQFQTEYRQHLYGRLGFTVFAATGQVWSSLGNMGIDHALWSAGGGLRFNLNKKDPMNIRIDMGFGQNTTGLYITLGEAF